MKHIHLSKSRSLNYMKCIKTPKEDDTTVVELEKIENPRNSKGVVVTRKKIRKITSLDKMIYDIQNTLYLDK